MRVLFAGYPGSETRIPTSFLLPFTSLFLVICFELPRTRPFSEFPSRLELSGVNCIPHWLNSRFFVCCKCVNQNSVPGALPNKFVKPYGYFFSCALPAGFVFGLGTVWATLYKTSSRTLPKRSPTVQRHEKRRWRVPENNSWTFVLYASCRTTKSRTWGLYIVCLTQKIGKIFSKWKIKHKHLGPDIHDHTM